MISYSIYLVDDEKTIRDGIALVLENEYQVHTFSSAEEALKSMTKDSPDLVLLDIGLPGMDGIEALRRIKDLHPHVLVIMITAYEAVNTVISAMKLGAYDYVVKPIHMDNLENTIANALGTIRLQKEVQELQEKYLEENIPCFVAESDVIQDMMGFIASVAQSATTPVLILGETGTGKELIAKAIHYRSPNYKGRLVAINCASVPAELIESELFGYERGAFSGANPLGKRGLVEAASNGTLFLDEVGDLGQEAQAKLLRFLDHGEFYRIGGTEKITVRTRIISATNKNLETMVERGTFRRDLYFRLGVVKVKMPSLNERQEDILPIAKYFLLNFGARFGKKVKGLTREAQKALMNHGWTGNVRELKNVMERAVLVGKGPELCREDLGLEEIDTAISATLPESLSLPPLPKGGLDLQQLQESIERHYITNALTVAGGNESKAASLLGLNHHTFRYKRKKLKIE